MLNRLSFITLLLLLVSTSQSENLKEQIESDNNISVIAGYFVITCLLIAGCMSIYVSGKRRITKSLKKIVTSSGDNLISKKNPEKIYKNFRDKILKETSKYFKTSRKNEEPFSNDIKSGLHREIQCQISYWVLYESARLSHRLEELSDRVQVLEKSSSPEIDNIKKEADEISRELAIFKKHFSDKDRLLNI
jgi:hypothetical protein